LEALHDRVVGFVEVLGGVFANRAIATTDMTALEAYTKVNPGLADL
jgi:hypothetical protein